MRQSGSSENFPLESTKLVLEIQTVSVKLEKFMFSAIKLRLIFLQIRLVQGNYAETCLCK